MLQCCLKEDSILKESVQNSLHFSKHAKYEVSFRVKNSLETSCVKTTELLNAVILLQTVMIIWWFIKNRNESYKSN